MREKIMKDNDNDLMILIYSIGGGVFASMLLTLFLFCKIMNRINLIDNRLNLINAPNGSPGVQFTMTHRDPAVTSPNAPFTETSPGAAVVTTPNTPLLEIQTRGNDSNNNNSFLRLPESAVSIRL